MELAPLMAKNKEGDADSAHKRRFSRKSSRSYPRQLALSAFIRVPFFLFLTG
jgi:hypothetical protein